MQDTHDRERLRWDQDRGELEREAAQLRQTLAALEARAEAPDAPPGLDHALRMLQEGGDTGPVEAILRDIGDRKKREGAEANAEAARAFRELAVLARWRDSPASLEAWRQVTELAPNDAWAWIERARMEQQVGDLEAAARSAARAVTVAETVGDPKAVCGATIEAGDIEFERGYLSTALASYMVANETISDLATRAPDDLGRQRDLSVSLEKIGDVHKDQGDLAKALDAYQQSLTIRQTLADNDPNNATWQRDLIVSHWKLAVANADLPDGQEAAIGYYRQALAVTRSLMADGRLAPVDGWFEDALLTRLAALGAGP